MTTRPLTTHPLMPLPAWQGLLPGAGEFAALLNVITDAALIVDRERRQVAFGNKGFFELTGIDPLEPKPLEIDKLLPAFGEGWSSGEERETNLQLPSGRKMAGWVTATWLDKPGHWLLFRFIPIEVHRWRSAQPRREQTLLGIMEELAGLTTQLDLDTALALALELGEKLLGAQGSCIYRADLQEPRLLRVMTHGKMANALPEILPLDESVSVYAPSIWLINQRPTTFIQQTARSAGIASLVSVPIELQGSRLGLLVAVELPPQNARQLIDALEILAAQIASALQHYVTVNNLRKTLWEHGRTLATRNAIAENSLEGIVLLSTTLKVQDLNPTAEMLLGYAASEVLGHPVENVLIGIDNLSVALRMALDGRSSPDLGSVNLHKRSGQAFPAHLQVFPVQVNGELTNIVLLLGDMSEREQIRARTQQLEQRALLGEVTAIFAHEVRNPINNLSMSLQLMEMNLPERDPQRDVVGRMQNDCNRLTHLMDSVLTFAKPIEYQLAPTNMNELMARLLERWHPRMARLNIEMHFQTEAKVILALADARALDQVFTNLISNALTAMKETGGTLAVKVEKAGEKEPPGWISISISDTGPGIPEEAREKIFEPFYTTSQQGTGLGLAITQRIVLAHKGKIKLTSFPGGTIFTVLLPGAGA